MQTPADLPNTIPAINPTTMSRAQRYTNGLLKPVGNLGRLEVLVIQLTGTPELNGISYVGRKAVLVMYADHGVWEKEVAIFPRGVTVIQAEDITRGTTGVRVLAAQAGANVHVVDVGIDSAEPISGSINMYVTRGSGNITSVPAMNRRQAEKPLLDVIYYTWELAKNDIMLFSVGELGMANTVSAAAIVSIITGRDSEEVVGIGTNLSTDKLANKADVARRAITLNQPNPQDDIDVLAKVEGLDLVGMAGMMLGAAPCGSPVLLDGFLSYAAAFATCQMSPTIKPHLIPSHLSAEKRTCVTLSHLGLEPYLNVEVRLGEGSGAALAMSIVGAACAIYSNVGGPAASNIVLPGNTTFDLNNRKRRV